MDAWYESFLIDRDPGVWEAPQGFPRALTPAGHFTQPVAHGLDVALAKATTKPSVADLRKAWSTRKGKKASPLLLIVGYPSAGGTVETCLCGPVGENPPVHLGIDISQAERMAATALAEPSHHAATRFLLAMMPELDSPTPGLRNVGLLATQELRAGVPDRPDWADATTKAKNLLAKRGRQLVEGLGFSVDPLAANASMLTIGGTNRAVAVFLDEGESFDAPAGKFTSSPVSHSLAVADTQGVPWVVLTRSSEIRLYAARKDTGVGRKGRAETFVEVNLSLLPEAQAAYLYLLFSAQALAPDGTIEDILSRSQDFAADLAIRLRERIYFDTVPTLAAAVARRIGDDPTDADLTRAYEQVMVILFRLLFVAYAEDKELLPYRTNSVYADHSLSRIVHRLVEARRSGTESFDGSATDIWDDVCQLWRAVDKGQTTWGVPIYNGGLFTDDPTVNPVGAVVAELALSDAEFGRALSAMLIDEGPEGFGPVDFRSLSVREFGTIYEGLLESQLSLAPSDLTVDKKGNFVPAGKKDDVVVAEGTVYFHNRSGARKDSGSYFTKPFAVEHLLDHALEPALDDHLARLDGLREAGDDAALAEAFFDFRCADIAMGSGHFLVAAVDRIEARLSSYLSLHPVAAVSAELATLRSAAYEALGELGDGIEIETGSLLRRQVARRCIYGVDRNHVSVELARLAVWIHTFVPGLPLSFLDHNLVFGDSLTGVGTLDEVVTALDPKADPNMPSLFRDQVTAFLDSAASALHRLGTIADSTKAEVDAARDAHREAMAAVAPAAALFDLIAARRAGVGQLPVNLSTSVITALRDGDDVDSVLAELTPVHFPTAFPEVFIRTNPGFNCILGNPPWEEATVEELGFWALRFPGLKSMKSGAQKREIAELKNARPDLVAIYEADVLTAEQMRRSLLAGPYPGMDEGDPDSYKAFCWRFWTLARSGGAVGVVLPRSALNTKGSREWRNAVLDGGEFADVISLLNNRKWVFDDLHAQWTIALVSVRKGDKFKGLVSMRGPFSSLDDFEIGVGKKPAQFPVEELRTWSLEAAFPMVPSQPQADAFIKMGRHPRLDGTDAPRERERERERDLHAPPWRARPVTEFHATNDKRHFELDQ